MTLTCKYWWQRSEQHKNGPAVEYKNGNTCWYQNDKLHRDDGPAIEYADGGTEWYQRGELHRDDGPAVVNTTGKHWYQNDEWHRDDGPAIELASGSNYWYKNGMQHRTDGPAIEYADGYIEWCIDGIELTPAEFAAKILDEETATMWKISGYCWPFDF
jgi:hypothetical protein